MDAYENLLNLLNDAEKRVDEGNIHVAKSFLIQVKEYAARYKLEIPKDRLDAIERKISEYSGK